LFPNTLAASFSYKKALDLFPNTLAASFSYRRH
jgi:hypothetical protein